MTFSSSNEYKPKRIPRQKNETRSKVLAYIHRFYAEHSCAPTYREVAKGVGKDLRTVQYHVEILIQIGALTKNIHCQISLQ